MKVLSPREASIFASLTDAVAGFDAWLAHAPQANRAAICAACVGRASMRALPNDHDHDPRDQIGPSPMSFLIDGPWLYANGRAIARASHPTPLAAGTMAVFWGVSIPLYLNQRWTRPLWRACRARSGRDWMINSGVLTVDADNVSSRGHVLSAAILATYPLWLWLGLRHGRR